MIDFKICEGLGVAIVLTWNRWFLGVSYETQPGARAFVFYFGPLHLHIVAACE